MHAFICIYLLISSTFFFFFYSLQLSSHRALFWTMSSSIVLKTAYWSLLLFASAASIFYLLILNLALNYFCKSNFADVSNRQDHRQSSSFFRFVLLNNNELASNTSYIVFILSYTCIEFNLICLMQDNQMHLKMDHLGILLKI